MLVDVCPYTRVGSYLSLERASSNLFLFVVQAATPSIVVCGSVGRLTNERSTGVPYVYVYVYVSIERSTNE